MMKYFFINVDVKKTMRGDVIGFNVIGFNIVKVI